MTEKKILVISGTHGNELNPIWGVNKFKDLNKDTTKLRSFEFTVGNPKAVQTGSRYIDVDLNRSFNNFNDVSNKNLYEVSRAQFLKDKYGIQGSKACSTAIDLHTTTSSMGSSIVMYGRREKDFCLAAILQSKFGLPIYLHEKDSKQTGFLVEAWPCGLVIEIGPVAQNHYDAAIMERFLIILDFLGDLIDNLKNKIVYLPDEITVFVHQNSIDYPRNENLEINALIHPSMINQDWRVLNYGDPLFLNFQDEIITYTGEEDVYPVFIGEAAYREKNIAMSFTKKEIIKCNQKWIDQLLNHLIK